MVWRNTKDAKHSGRDATTHNHEKEQHASAKTQQAYVPHPHPPACIGNKRHAAACKREVGKEGATHRHKIASMLHATHEGEQPRAKPTPSPHVGKRGERYAHTHTGDPHPPPHAAYTGKERPVRTSKSPQARHDRQRHGQAPWYEGTRRVKNVRTHINTSAGTGMLHATQRNTQR